MSKGNVLLVDDDPKIVEQFASTLRNEDYEKDSTFSGAEGWEKGARCSIEPVLSY